MVKTLMEIARSLRVATLELAGAGLIVDGVWQLGRSWSHGAAFIVGGVMVLGKSLELDLRSRGDRDQSQR